METKGGGYFVRSYNEEILGHACIFEKYVQIQNNHFTPEGCILQNVNSLKTISDIQYFIPHIILRCKRMSLL